MSIGTKADFVVYDEQLQTGVTEVLQQYAEGVEAGTNGAIRLVTRFSIGDFNRAAFFEVVDDLIKERDPNSTAALASTSLSQAEKVGVKVHRSIYQQNTLDSFRKIGSDMSLMSFVLGRQIGSAVAINYLNTGLTALTAAIESLGNVVVTDVADDTTPVTVTTGLLNQARAKFGDAALSRMVCWVMSSKSYFDLVGHQIAEKVTGLTDVVVYGGSPATLGLPVYITDSPALMDTVAGEYKILGLTAGALVLEQSEESATVSDIKTGLQNLVAEFQSEYTFNVNVKGFSYGGSANPSLAVLGNEASWDQVVGDVKSTAGVMLITN